jgi:hypothetical protein
VLSGKLSDRHDALARLRAAPSTAFTDWSQRFAKDQARVLACQTRLDTTRAKVAANNVRRAEDESTGAMVPGRRP